MQVTPESPLEFPTLYAVPWTSLKRMAVPHEDS